ncbi:MAG TPA: hypothetical protein VKR82_01225 [Candidatus Acidoferrales bacterium]|nr:hypothetical protein [Candidatus Acidoferrales bacterium]
MKGIVSVALGMLLAVSLGPAFAQGGGQQEQHQQHRGNGGRIPPPPSARPAGYSEREGEKIEGGKIDNRQHVNNDHWYGHDSPDDKRFLQVRQSQYGRFEHVGRSFLFRIGGFDRDRHMFWFPGGFYFEVAAWDWPETADWCWDCPEDFVVYDDPDHPGWYLLYNTETGTYVHVQYLGTR